MFLIPQARNAFIYAHGYQVVRLAVPLPWETRLVSKLPKYLALEVPLTVVFLFALPTLLSAQRHRTLLPTYTTWRTVFHLLSGDAQNSLISSAGQRTLILLISGIISLLIQFPVNLLKCEVVSSTWEQRVRPSNCAVSSCETTGMRELWYLKDEDTDAVKGPGNIIGRLENIHNLKSGVSAANLEEGCAPASASSSGMWKWTTLALLTQYLTICNDPVLLKMQLSSWERELAFETIPGSHGAETLCSLATSTGGQVELRKHYQITQRILAHNLLKHRHLLATLGGVSSWDERFWGKARANERWAHPERIKPKIRAAMRNLKEGYKRYRMLDRELDSKTIGVREMREIFLTFTALVVAISLGVLVSVSASA